MMLFFSAYTAPLPATLIFSGILLALGGLWLHFKAPVFRIKEKGYVSPPKEKVSVDENIKKYKEEQARKKGARKWLG